MGKLAADDVAALLEAASDVALVLDERGVVRDLAFGAHDLTSEGYGKWLGKPWVDTVTIESREKIEALLRDATPREPGRARQVNHPARQGQDVPISYNALQVGDQGHVVALGRDLRPVSTLQQKLVVAQQSMEREYARLRHAETRYRLLFHIASEAVVIVDSATETIVEANPAAGDLLSAKADSLAGEALAARFDSRSARVLRDLLARARTTGHAGDARARLAKGKAEFLVTASQFRQERGSYALVRLMPLNAHGPADKTQNPGSKLLKVIENSSDGLVVTAPDGRVLTANRAFLELAQLASEEQARGESLDRWLGRPGVDLSVLISNLREHGAVRLFATSLRGEYGSTAEVEICAVSVPEGELPCLGFMIRDVSQRLMSGFRPSRELPRSVEQLTELVGRVSLKEIVRETTDVIERLCIEAALQLTSDNRASAAEMLGLSRQSLYVKLRRHGFADLASETEH